jgi:hypothetical protein
MNITPSIKEAAVFPKYRSAEDQAVVFEQSSQLYAAVHNIGPAHVIAIYSDYDDTKHAITNLIGYIAKTKF